MKGHQFKSWIFELREILREIKNSGRGRFWTQNDQVQEIRELRIPTRKTNPIHNDVPENTTFLLPDQPSGEANTTGTLISKIDEVAINAKTANWKAIVMFLILQFTNKRIIYHLISLSAKKLSKKKCIEDTFFTLQKGTLDHASIYIDSQIYRFILDIFL